MRQLFVAYGIVRSEEVEQIRLGVNIDLHNPFAKWNNIEF